jgi:hypothetical protein
VALCQFIPVLCVLGAPYGAPNTHTHTHRVFLWEPREEVVPVYLGGRTVGGPEEELVEVR